MKNSLLAELTFKSLKNPVLAVKPAVSPRTAALRLKQMNERKNDF